MKHRTQLYLDRDQHRWLKQRARRQGGSIAAVVRRLIDDARRSSDDPFKDPLIAFLLSEPTEARPEEVSELDKEIYGSCERSS